MRESGEGEDDPKIEEEMVVERVAVRACVGGKVPWRENHGVVMWW